MHRHAPVRATLATLATAVLVGISTGAVAPAHATESSSGVCAGLSSGKTDVSGSQSSITVTAPAGSLISGYCVKAGSTASGDGPVYVTIDPPRESVTLTYPSGKDLSHYSLSYVAQPTEGDSGETPGDGGETPGTGGETPGDGDETPGTGGETPGTGGETPGDGDETPGTGDETPGTGGETPGDTEVGGEQTETETEDCAAVQGSGASGGTDTEDCTGVLGIQAGTGTSESSQSTSVTRSDIAAADSAAVPTSVDAGAENSSFASATSSPLAVLLIALGAFLVGLALPRIRSFATR
jgi:hypothetical protein